MQPSNPPPPYPTKPQDVPVVDTHYPLQLPNNTTQIGYPPMDSFYQPAGQFGGYPAPYPQPGARPSEPLGPPPPYQPMYPSQGVPVPPQPAYYPTDAFYPTAQPNFQSSRMYPAYPPIGSTVLIPSAQFDANARFSQQNPPSIPPPPPGCTPNLAQQYAQMGYQVQMSNRRRKNDAGWTFW